MLQNPEPLAVVAFSLSGSKFSVISSNNNRFIVPETIVQVLYSKHEQENDLNVL